MADVSTIANYAEIFGAIVVLGGLFFAILELRRAREQRQEQEEQRRREAAYQVFAGLGSKEFRRGVRSIYEMPEGLSKKEVEENYPAEDVENIHWALTQFENLAMMVLNRMVPLDLAFDFFQPALLATASKLKGYIRDSREETGSPLLATGVEWLAGHIEAMSTEADVEAVKRRLAEWRP